MGFEDEYSLSPEQVASLSEEWKLAYVARLLWALALNFEGGMAYWAYRKTKSLWPNMTYARQQCSYAGSTTSHACRSPTRRRNRAHAEMPFRNHARPRGRAVRSRATQTITRPLPKSHDCSTATDGLMQRGYAFMPAALAGPARCWLRRPLGGPGSTVRISPTALTVPPRVGSETPRRLAFPNTKKRRLAVAWAR